MKDALVFGFINAKYNEQTEDVIIEGVFNALCYEILSFLYSIFCIPRMVLDKNYDPRFPIKVIQ